MQYLDKTLLEWTRPLCEVICVVGLLMTAMAHGRKEMGFCTCQNFISVLFHVSVGISCWGAPFTLRAACVCFAVLLCALGVYAAFHSQNKPKWPYPLSPFETIVLSLAILGQGLVPDE